MDLTPFANIYSYKVVGNTIKYGYGKNKEAGIDGVMTDDIITSLTKNELVLNGTHKFKRTK